MNVGSNLQFSGVKIISGDGSTTFIYPAARNKKISLMTLLFGLFCTSGTFYFYVKIYDSFKEIEGQLSGVMISLMVPSFSVFGIISIALIIYGVYLLINSLKVEIDGKGLKTVRALSGINILSKSIAFDEIDDFELKGFVQRGSGNAANILFAIRINLKDGRRITAGDGIDRYETAGRLMEIMKDKCGYSNEWIINN